MCGKLLYSTLSTIQAKSDQKITRPDKTSRNPTDGKSHTFTYRWSFLFDEGAQLSPVVYRNSVKKSKSSFQRINASGVHACSFGEMHDNDQDYRWVNKMVLFLHASPLLYLCSQILPWIPFVCILKAKKIMMVIKKKNLIKPPHGENMQSVILPWSDWLAD